MFNRVCYTKVTVRGHREDDAMSYDKMFQAVLEHIDEHIKDELSAEALAEFAGFSTFHFCRFFGGASAIP